MQLQNLLLSAAQSDNPAVARIVLVDDSATSRMLLESILRNAGYKNLHTAPTALQALELLRTLPRREDLPPADLVLMDINMPGMDGISAVRELKADPDLEGIPVIMVTVSDDRSNLEDAFRAGAIDYINKPVNKLELLARVRTVLSFRNEMSRRLANEQGVLDLTSNLGEAYRQLEELNQSLEHRVRERTAELERANAELLELDRMKTIFISNVSHELRTPLTSVLGFAGILRSRFRKVILPELRTPGSIPQERLDKIVDQVEKNLDILLLESQRLTTRINDVLDITRMESGQMEWRDEPVHLEELLRRAKEQSAPAMAEKNLTFTLQVKGPLPVLRGDPERLLQAIRNLLGNAMKFTEEGCITCTAEHKDGEVLVCVSDTGPGFPDSDYATVFEMFRQLGDGLTDKPQGVGLGVPICAHIVKHHGGRFWAKSAPGKGTTFSFTLPVPTLEQS